MFLLDTNVISELRVGKPAPSAAVRRWAERVPANQLYLAAITVLELEIGVLAMERKDAHQGQKLRSWLRAVLQQFSTRILPFGTNTALLCAPMHVPDRRPERDDMIAATGREHGYTLVSRNTDDFQGCGIPLLNPWLQPDPATINQRPKLDPMPETTTTDILPIPTYPFRAYLFDLDGTVADSMPLHLISWQQATREFGGDFPTELFWQWGGIPLPRTVEMLNERFGYHLDPTEVVHRKEQLYLTMLDPVLDKLHPIKAVVAHVAAQHGHLPMAIVSGSPRLTIVKTLEALKLSDCFQVIVGAEDYTHGKPDPEPFLTAAKLLNIPPADCLVFEDAEAGIQSAIAAGMQYVRVPVHHLTPTPTPTS